MKSIRRLSLRKFSEDEIKALYEPLLSQIIQIAKPIKVILFGSALTKNFDECSDLDFFVVVPDGSATFGLLKDLYRIRIRTTVSLDFICMSQSEYEKNRFIGGVSMTASQEGKVLFDVANK